MNDATKLRDATVYSDWLHPDERAEALAILHRGRQRQQAATAELRAKWDALVAANGVGSLGHHAALAVVRITKTQMLVQAPPSHGREGPTLRVSLATGCMVGVVYPARFTFTALPQPMRGKVLAALDALGGKMSRGWRDHVEGCPEVAP